jgi:peroxiredoxin
MRWLVGTAFLTLAAASLSLAGEHNTKLSVGDAAPNFEGLKAVDGKTYSMGDFKDKDVLVLVFTCNDCPVAQAYNERFNDFVTKHKSKPVGFLAVNCSVDPVDPVLDAMKGFHKKQGLKYTYAHDGTQKSGKAYGATVTPHVFVINKDRKVVYMGAWDDSWQDADQVEKHYAVDAVEAALAGKTPKTGESSPVGCGIAYVSAKDEE